MRIHLLRTQRLLSLAYSILSNRFDALDAVYNVYVELLSKPRLTEKLNQAEFEAYMAAAVRNRCLELLRQRQRHAKVPLDDSMIAPEPDLDRKLQIQHCLSRLRPQEREILLLHSQYGYTYRDISQRLGISEDAAMKRYERAKDRLLELCEEEGLL